VEIDQWDARCVAERAAAVAFPGERIELIADGEHDVLWHIRVDGRERGHVRRVALDAPVWAAPAFGVELSLGAIESAPVTDRAAARASVPAAARATRRYSPIPSTPASVFDLALVVPDGVSAEAVAAIIRRTAGELLERLTVFDEYVGTGVEQGSGERSLAWRLTFRHPERTLRDKEIEGRRNKILGALAEQLNVRQRTS
jgi:phenylalanyl-tRNA synthetase beta chain